MNTAFYRLPYADTYTQIRSEDDALRLCSYDDLDGREGFVIAPFCITGQTPLLLLAGTPRTMPLPACTDSHVLHATTDGTDGVGAEYARDFGVFHHAVATNRFDKLVLARTRQTRTDGQTAEQLFFRLCHDYPRAMVMLIDTEITGTWLIASPEILIESQPPHLCTIALAGTMPYSEGLPQWSEKNKHEQHIVERYIEDTIAPMAAGIIKDGPRTVRAGNLMHLRTDFRFRPHEGIGIGSLVARLHPTPAVCGMPKEGARQFIIDHESTDRRYYSGFAGPLNIGGETHLYVSLRCMNIAGGIITTYAGGGIMPDSNMEDEWHETELKMILR